MKNMKKLKQPRRKPAPSEPAPKKNGWREYVSALVFGLMFMALLVGSSYVGASIAMREHVFTDSSNTFVANADAIPKQYYKGVCRSETFKDEADVYMMPERKTGILGQYIANQRAIVLRSKDIDTIAHEVSHLVDSIVATHGINDGESRAYLQGYFTKCVYDTIREDIIVIDNTQ